MLPRIATFTFVLIALVVNLPAQRTLHAIHGQQPGGRLGSVVAGLYDLTLDGVPELAARALDRVDVFDGATGALLFQIQGPAGQDFGTSIRPHPDANQDGWPDILIGAPASSNQALPGSVMIYSGFDGSFITSLVGNMPGDQFGAAIEVYDDLDGNGILDLVIAATHADTPVQDSGTVYIRDPLSGLQNAMLPGVTINDGYGSSLAVLDDISGDGLRELAVGSPRGNQTGTTQGLYAGTGVVTVHKGGGTWNPIIQFFGQTADDFYGSALAAVGDVDGDGIPDLAIGAPGVDSTLGLSVGMVELRSLPFGGLIAQRPGLAASDRYGDRLAALPDIDGDLVPELVVGAPNAGANAEGRIEILRGSDGQLLHTVLGQGAFENLGSSVAPLLDFGLDGRGEFVFGAPGSSGSAFFAGRLRSLSFRLGVYGLAARGVSNLSAGPGQRPLRIDASAGGFHDGRREIGVGQAFSISVDQPLGNPQPAAFVIWGAFGIPAATDGFEMPYGLGRMLFAPAICYPGLQPWLFTLVDGFGLGLPDLAPATPTPFLATNPGIPFPLEVTFQGILENSPGQLARTNAIVLVIL